MNYSKQREVILKYLQSVNTHPTAETIYNSVKKEYPSISLGTVYRNLDKLSKNGDIKRLNFGDSKDRFDGNISNHYHIICQKCGNIYDIFADYFDSIDKIVEKEIGCSVMSHNISFDVICPNCKN